jgi:uncharacterized protein YejL (UPF0352 family)
MHGTIIVIYFEHHISPVIVVGNIAENFIEDSIVKRNFKYDNLAASLCTVRVFLRNDIL